MVIPLHTSYRGEYLHFTYLKCLVIIVDSVFFKQPASQGPKTSPWVVATQMFFCNFHPEFFSGKIFLAILTVQRHMFQMGWRWWFNQQLAAVQTAAISKRHDLAVRNSCCEKHVAIVQRSMGAMMFFFQGFEGCATWNHILGGGFKYCYFHPYLGKWSNLTNIFQMGWNHQLV